MKFNLAFFDRPRRVVRPARCIGLVALMVLGSTGCQSLALPKLRLPGSNAPSAFVPGNHVDAGAIPAGIRRIAVVPMHADGWLARETDSLESAVRSELGMAERFEIVAISRAEFAVRFGRESFASTDALPADLLPRLRADFGVDGVLLVDLTHYTPYQPLGIGLRAKLISTGEGLALWSFDGLFDATHPEVVAAARRFSSGEKRVGPSAEDNSGVLQSPARFARYVGHAMFETLPPRGTE